jgi:hypothetical protein
MIEKKIILTENELKTLLVDTYVFAFQYSRDMIKEQAEHKKVWTSKGRDVLTYVRDKLKGIMI